MPAMTNPTPEQQPVPKPFAAPPKRPSLLPKALLFIGLIVGAAGAIYYFGIGRQKAEAQAAVTASIKTATVQRWLATRKIHGIRTPGGQHRVCQQSLFAHPSPPSFPDDNAPHQTTSNSTEEPCLSIPLVHSAPQS